MNRVHAAKGDAAPERASMEGGVALLPRALPWLIVAIAAAAHALAWRTTSVQTWRVLGAAYAVMAGLAALSLGRAKRLAPLFVPVAGDVSAGAIAGASALVATFAAAVVAFRLRGEAASLELLALLRVLVVVESSTFRALALVGFAALEELVWRGAVTGALAERMGPVRAAVSTTLLATACAAASGHPAVVIATLLLGASCAVVRHLSDRLVPAVLAHAAFSWFAVSWMIPELYARMLPTP